MPGGAKSLTAGMPTTATLGDGSRQGLNDFRRPGYGGPCPPKGSTHRYEFTLYALGHPLDVDAAAGAAEVEKAIKQSKIAAARLAGRYSRQ